MHGSSAPRNLRAAIYDRPHRLQAAAANPPAPTLAATAGPQDKEPTMTNHPPRYTPEQIEQRWQERWERDGLYRAKVNCRAQQQMKLSKY